jgi:hypothetical protein
MCGGHTSDNKRLTWLLCAELAAGTWEGEEPTLIKRCSLGVWTMRMVTCGKG